MIRLVIADDEQLIRGALAALLTLEPDINVIGEAADGVSAVDAALIHRPDIALLDLEMPGLDGVDAARQIIAHSDAIVVIVTRHARSGALRRALSAGVRGFVPKSTPAGELADIIRRVASGERYVDAGLAAAALSEDESPLTPRETDVLRLTEQGLSLKQIARELGLAAGTVRNHASAAITKLHADSGRSAARIARDRGWI